MKKLYVTNSETEYNYDRETLGINLYGRTEDGEADKIRVEGLDPYFFVHREAAKDIKPSNYESIVAVEAECGEESLMGDPLGRVEVDHPAAISDYEDTFGKSWEADVEFTNRLRIDEDIKTGVSAPASPTTAQEIEPVDMRVEERRVTFDIEIDDRGEFPEHAPTKRILSIVAHDNYTGDLVAFFDTGGRSLQQALPGVAEEGEAPGDLDELIYRPNERDMMMSFVEWISEVNPDLIVGWNSSSFDVPYTINRMKSLDIDPDRLARDGGEVNPDSYGSIIEGRCSYDMMWAWESTKFTEPDSKKLDHAASVELDEAKLDYDEDGTWDMYENNPRELLLYNAKDVVLTHKVGEKAVYAFKRRLRNMVGVSWDETIQNNDFVGMMVRRKLSERGQRGPTKTPPPSGANEYEGAYTLDAYTGVASNVVEIDLSSLYPMTIWMLNASPETKLTEEEARARDFEDVAKAPNGVYYDLREEGLFKSLVSDALELKMAYKKDIKSAEPGSVEESEAQEAYNVAKNIVNSIYGVTGWVWFFLYDKEVAESITVMSQQVIRKTETWVNEKTDGEVIYGDTDSCYIEYPDDWSQVECLQQSAGSVRALNEAIYPKLAEQYGMGSVECRWEMELEKYCSSFFQAGKKKRYAFLKTWQDGMDYDDKIEKFDITGFETERSDTAHITRDLQKEVLEAAVRGEPEEEIGDIVYQRAKEIDPEPDDWEYIGIPGGIGSPLDSYENDTAQVKGAKNANKFLGLNLGVDDKPFRCYLTQSRLSNGEDDKRAEVICYENNSEVKNEGLKVDVDRMQKTVIKKPMDEILSALGIDVDAAVRGQTQTGIAAFM